MWLIPTRARPGACSKLIAAMQATGDIPDAAVMIDDDPAVYAGVNWPPHWRIHVAPKHLELTAAVNALAGFYPGASFYGLLADHARPRTPGWAKRMQGEAGDWNIAYSDDGWQHGRRRDDPSKPRLTGAVCLGGKLVKALGWVLLPTAVHLYVDDALEHIGQRLGLLRYVPDVLVEADRPETTGRARDKNHHREFEGKSYPMRDRRAFHHWRDTQSESDIARIRSRAC